MSDNKNLKHVDARTIASGEKYEQSYALLKLRVEFPHHTTETVRNALVAAEKAAQPSEDRTKIMDRARKNLK